MKPFKRRYYRSVGELGRDVVWPFRHRRQLRLALRGGLVDFAFRERLMLAVTAVNDCRYCSYFHAKEALRADLSETEIRQMQDGILDLAPAQELPALLYAQHWAESDAHPDPAARQKLVQTYGLEQAEAIETVLRMIRTGNLAGNTADFLIFRLSFGRLGVTRDERAQAPA
ncbi:MAG: carboxymuconolactone decarboxylase family protein [Chloroflexota bacterium]